MTVPPGPTRSTPARGSSEPRPRPDGAAPPAPPASPKSRSRRTVLLAGGAALAVVVAGGGAVLLLGGDGDGDGTPTPSPSTPSASASETTIDTAGAAAVTLGVFRDNDPEETAAYADWLGHPVDVAVVFGARDTWDHIADPRYLLEGWRDAPQRLSFGLPMLPEEDDSATIEKGATGEYDDVFREFAQALVDEGQQDAILRLGWEFNLDGSRWSSDDPSAWIAYYRSIVAAMRSVDGQQFAFDWNVNNGNSPQGDPVDYYPGDDVVDYVGVDAYDVAGGPYPIPDGCTGDCPQQRHQAAWDEYIYGGDRGLQFWSGFAADHGKPLSLPEWGLWDKTDGTGGGENPWYIQKMAEFMADSSHDVAYQAYFEHDDQGTHRLMTGFPESSEVFRSIFAG